MDAAKTAGATNWERYIAAQTDCERKDIVVDAFISSLRPLLDAAYENGVDTLEATIKFSAQGPIFPGHDVGLRLQEEGMASVLQLRGENYHIRVNAQKNGDATAAKAKQIADELFQELHQALEGTNRVEVKLVKQARHPDTILPSDSLLEHLYGKIRVTSHSDSVNARLRELVEDRLPRECAAIDAVYRLSGADVVIVEAMRVHDRLRCCASSAVDDSQWLGTEAVTENALFCC